MKRLRTWWWTWRITYWREQEINASYRERKCNIRWKKAWDKLYAAEEDE